MLSDFASVTWMHEIMIYNMQSTGKLHPGVRLFFTAVDSAFLEFT